MLAIGLMSGTSCDGMSGALIRLAGNRPAVRLVSWTTIPYPAEIRGFLLGLAAGEKTTAAQVARAGALIADYSIHAVSRLCRHARVGPGRVAFIGVHGHTLYHTPGEGITFQAGDLSRIAEVSGITTVGDFRTRDVAAGGQGAPLAPWPHWVLFAHRRDHRLILNLGGIANVTWLPAGRGPKSVVAFDTGPANMIMDALAEKYSDGRRVCDAGGRLAARGRMHGRVLVRLLRHPYFRRRPPKSTGREEFGAGILPSFRGLSAADALATATELTARSVASQVARWLPAEARVATVYAGGGGCRNPALMRQLRLALAPRRLLPLNALGLPEQAVEPVCFALLGHARLSGRPNVLPRVTGAARAVSSGVIVPAR
jgi:anhydro-N-acetylmuramic acid kinase